MPNAPRVAVRAILLHEGRLLMVNAYANGQSALMCPPGGGVEPGSSLPDNLRREVFEETGLQIEVGEPCLVNEFHDPGGSFHQVDIYFRCSVIGSAEIKPNWEDTDKIVTVRRWLTETELSEVHHKPDSLRAVAFDPAQAITYDPLEPLVR
ncbi:NUDIX hydrolase [Sulfitobacter mediterraneus]|uniref:NUDIX domain-containing protein n=2 Tax=Sulfitobacter mediterraneus TaxID=83219 RepID=UPI001931AD80|nr:NUDIX hydrolase [Sulfitobacter mediterraneus]MBM1633716.1 NUDIX hydrolase [Sulfitobacter mediterraneus]MBM1641769.1 NUDIX hydrolase [Sulfitobacter mediterraneus]MBM1645580.1 NUDIX hydrolase [Sulfitobacter mediterraneus]MBM1649888.1 NUDIX hydrolase [Sulfitobacter mediterraneus]MBM1653649.1 NUDIX hydrolase [Sulfitobacter mediterraneus]